MSLLGIWRDNKLNSNRNILALEGITLRQIFSVLYLGFKTRM